MGQLRMLNLFEIDLHGQAMRYFNLCLGLVSVIMSMADAKGPS